MENNSNMINTNSMRRLIENAKLQEQSTHAFFQHIYAAADQLWANRGLTEEDKSLLVEFANAYIQIVPELTDQLLKSAADTELEDSVVPAVGIVVEFFERSPSSAKSLTYQLLAQAFFANRLYEDMNAHSKVLLDISLVPFDLTMANIMVYQLIGESFAAELDALVEQIAGNLVDIQRTHLNKISFEQKEQWDRSWQATSIGDLEMPQALMH